MKILKKSKKGFTLVELVVVIAVIAILAAVSVGVYFGVTESAKKSNDQTVTNQMNKALLLDATVNGKPKTPTDALEVLEESGFDVMKMTPFQDGAYYLWDSIENKMILVNKEGNVDFPTDVDNPTTSANPEKYFGFIQSDTEKQTQDYSYYLKNGYSGSTTFTAGIDTGNNNLESVSYENSDEQEVIIRTNSATTELIVNAPNGTVKHYDAVGTVHVIAVDDENCYEENGKAAFTQVDSGKYETTSTADVELLFVSNSSNVTLEITEGTVDHAYAISEAEANTINNTNPGVTFDYDGNIGLTEDYSNNKTNETIIDVIETAVEKEAVEADESDFWIVCRADAFASGSGTEQDPYVIKTARQLSLLAYNVNTLQAGYDSAYYRLDKNIDLSGKAWTPIGTTNGTDTLFFKGHFDGNGKSIIGLTNNGKSDVDLGLYSDELSSVKGLAASYGLFGFTQNVNISNLTMESASIDGSNHFKEAGIIIGMATGSTIMTNCTVDGDSSISGKSKIGGLIGYVNLSDFDNGLGGNVNLTNCDFAGAVTVSADRAGALVGAFCAHQSGYNLGHTHVFKDCDSTGTVSSGKYGTGLIGYVYQGHAYNTYGIKTFTFDNCSADTSKFSTNGRVGKYIGRHSDATSTIIIKGTDETYSTNLIGDLNSNGSFILGVNGQFYGYNYNQSGPSAMPSLDSNIKTYKVSQMITNAPGKEYESYWKTDRMEDVVPYMTLIKIDETSLDVTSGELKYGAGWYDTKIADFSSFVAEGYHIVTPENYATYDSNGTHYIWQVVADSE